MKKNTFLLTIFFLTSVPLLAQIKLGFKFSPAIAFNSAVSKDLAFDGINNNGSGLRFSAGPVADYFFADNYAFHTGLWYTVKRSGIDGRANNTPYTSIYNLQYLQLPLGLKFFTNEVATDMKIYFLFGGTIDVKLAEKPLDKSNNQFYLNADGKSVYKPADVGLLLGVGGELIMGTNTATFFGISYNRGLANALANGSKINESVKSRNSLFSLDLGVKF